MVNSYLDIWKKYSRVKVDNSYLRGEVNSLRDQVDTLTDENIELRNENRKQRNIISKVKKVIGSKQFNQLLNSPIKKRRDKEL